MESIEAALSNFLDSPAMESVVYQPLRTPVWLYDFCVDVCGYDKMQPQPHYDLCAELEDIVKDCQFNGQDRTAILIEMPRGNYKTTIAGEGLPVAILTKNPNARILITTHKEKTSVRRLEAIKSHFEKNAVFKKKFGDDWRPDRGDGAWSSKNIVVSRRTRVLREPSVEVAALGADMTGSHYNVIVVDDVVNPENVKKQEQRDNVASYIDSMFSLLDPGGVLIIIGTRWHPDDAYGRIIESDKKREASGLKPLYRKYIRSCYDGPGGLLFPAEYGFEQLEDILERIKERAFAANYLNQPVADVDKVFKPEHLVERDFTYYRNSGTSGVIRCGDDHIPVYVTLAWDTSGTKIGAKSDYHGFTVRGTDHHGRAWTLEAAQFKGTVSEVIAKSVAMVMFYRPEKVILEAIGSWQLWVDAFNRELTKYGISVPILEARHRGISKEERIQMLEPYWKNGGIIVRSDQVDFKRQLDNFSMTSTQTHDDIIDSFAMHLGHTEEAAEEYTIQADNPIDTEALLRNNRRGNQTYASRYHLGRRR